LFLVKYIHKNSDDNHNNEGGADDKDA